MPPVGASLQLSYQVRYRQAVNKSITWRMKGITGRSLGVVYDLANEPRPSLFITLDTTPPVVTFGVPVETWDRLVVPYAVNEPAVESAWLVDAAGVAHPVTVAAGELVVNLAIVEVGEATVTARARDDVWNEADYTLAVTIEGLPMPHEPTPGGLPGGVSRPPRRERQRQRPRSFRTRTRVAVASTSRVERRVEVVHRPLRPVATTALRVQHGRARARVQVASTASTARQASTRLDLGLRLTFETSRRDGPGLEEEIILGLV